MKKTLLTLGAALLLSAGVFAQTPEENSTNSDVSQNAPTATKKGYAFNWSTGSAEAGDAEVYNCMAAKNESYNPFNTAGYSFKLEKGSGYVTFSADGTQGQYASAVVKFQSGNCTVGEAVDLSSSADLQTLSYKVKSDADVSEFAVSVAFQNGDALLLADLDFPKNALKKGEWTENKITIPAKGWDGATSANIDVDFTKIIGIWFKVKNGESANISVDYVTVGDGTPAPTALTDAEIAALDVKVFPNPASDVLNVSYNVPADEQVTVTLSNSLGQAVASVEGDASSASIDVAGLNGGLYFASIVVDGIVVATQKVIVE